MKIKWLLALSLLTISSLGCGEAFDPYWRIVDYRLLAIRSDLPKLKPNDTATIDALISSENEVTYAWEWCPITTSPSEKYKCGITDEELNSLIEDQTGVPGDFNFDLGSAPEASFAYPAPQPVILGLCKALQQALTEGIPGVPVVKCERGLDISLRLSATSNGETIVASKRLNLWLVDDQPNQSPDVTSIQIRPTTVANATWMLEQGADWVVDPNQPKENWWVDLDEFDPPEVWAGVSYEIRSVVDPSSIDIWEPPAPTGSEQERLPAESENLVFRWMVSAGSLSDSTRIYDEELNDLKDSSISEFEISKGEAGDRDEDGVPDADDACPTVPKAAPDEAGGCPVSLWSIIRDGRFGVDWHERSVRVVGMRP